MAIMSIMVFILEVAAMVTITSKEAKEKFGALVDTARREPVTITKHNRPTVVVISSERYAELETLEDELWAAKAREAEKKGYLSTEESEAMIQGIMNAEA
ncbi:MAG: type II toxin-antitoxin system prevent-host-death family antitoxin [Armatimonadota bacterium]|nr:type II toxin-antitoxin system prevent-host-death family antitoxin [Armatimonadota bacterium]